MTLGKWSIPRTFIDLPVIFLFSGRAAFAVKNAGRAGAEAGCIRKVCKRIKKTKEMAS